MERRQHDPTFPALNKKRPLWRTMATPGAAAGGGDTAKAMVAEQISQSVQSTSNLLRLMQHSSPAQAQLIKLPKNLLAKVSTIKNTEQVLEQLPGVISSLDAHMENGLQNIPHLKTVVQLLANMESSQLSSLSRTDALEKRVCKVIQLEKVVNTYDDMPKFRIGTLVKTIQGQGLAGY